MRRFNPAILARLGVLLALAAAGSPLPPAPGAELVYRNCTECHALTTVLAARGLDRPGWSAVLERMEGYGLALSDEERARLLDYLAAQLGDRPAPAPATPAAADGKALYQEHCAACHQDPERAPPLRDRPAWREHPDYVAQVVLFGLSGPLYQDGRAYDAPMEPLPFLSDAQVAAIVEYLTQRPFTAEAVARERAKGLTPSLVRLLRPAP